MDFFANLAFQVKLELGMWKPLATMRYRTNNCFEHPHWCSVCDSEIFLKSKFSYLLFRNPTNKLKQGLQIGGK
jgi:hypothetical protein